MGGSRWDRDAHPFPLSLTVQLYLIQSSQKREAENFFRITTVMPWSRHCPIPTMFPEGRGVGLRGQVDRRPFPLEPPLVQPNLLKGSFPFSLLSCPSNTNWSYLSRQSDTFHGSPVPIGLSTHSLDCPLRPLELAPSSCSQTRNATIQPGGTELARLASAPHICLPWVHLLQEAFQAITGLFP